VSGYGEVVLTWVQGRQEPLVERADLVALCSVAVMRDTPAFVEPDLLCAGTTEDGEFVWYRIWGWEPQYKALIIKRTEAPA